MITSFFHFRSFVGIWALSISLLILNIGKAHADVRGRVVAVTDGDTIKVLDANNIVHKIRLSGIDAPEHKQPFGKVSQNNLASLVANRQVHVDSDRQDRYGRALGKVWVDDIDVNLAQVRLGYAWWYKYYAKQQSVEDRKNYEQAEINAREERIGLWGGSRPIKPADWRRGVR